MTTSYHFPVLSVILFASFFLTACGGSEQDGAVSQDKNASNHTAAVKPKEGAKASASTAEKTRKCPAQPATGMRPDGVPVDDIVGIRPGMHIDDVLWVLECRDDVPLVEVGEKWNIKQTHGFPLRQLIRASDGTPCSGQEIVRDMGGYGTSKQCNDAGYQLQAVKAISQEFEVVFTGMPGDELAGAVWRRNVFAEGENPTIEALTQSLSGKYGAPHVTEKDRQGRTLLSWQYDLLNRPMSHRQKISIAAAPISMPFLGKVMPGPRHVGSLSMCK